MKKMKKVMALLLSLVMVLAMSVVAFAGEAGSSAAATSGTYTITAPAGSHKYEIYQIFTGDLAGTVLSNLKWGVSKPLKPGEVTAPIFTAVTFNANMGNEYQNATATVDVFAQAVQTANNGATVMDAQGWPRA